MQRIEHLTDTALWRIAEASDHNYNIIVGNSGGKDSCVILDLVKRVLPPHHYRIIHNVKPLLGTSGDAVGALTEMHPLTLEFFYNHVCKENEVTLMHSSKMEAYVNEEYISCQIDGSRLCEYTREGKSSSFIQNGELVSRSQMSSYMPKGIFGLNMCYPIFDWSDQDVFDYIHLNGVKISDEYIANGELRAHGY